MKSCAAALAQGVAHDLFRRIVKANCMRNEIIRCSRRTSSALPNIGGLFGKWVVQPFLCPERIPSRTSASNTLLRNSARIAHGACSPICVLKIGYWAKEDRCGECDRRAQKGKNLLGRYLNVDRLSRHDQLLIACQQDNLGIFNFRDAWA
jgi:hypothetical protein